MRPGLFVVTARGSLHPANGRTQEELRELRLRPGDFVSVRVLRARNAKLCALANVVIAKMAEGLGVPSETIKTRLKLVLGYCDLIQKPDGSIEEKPRSMAFDDLEDEDDFVEFWRACEEIICSKLLPLLEPDEQESVLAIMQGRGRP